MNFYEVALAFQAIDQTQSRTTITEHLAHLLKKATPDEAAFIAYLSLGEVRPCYLGNQFNFSTKGIYKVLAHVLAITEKEVQLQAKQLGDVGLILEKNHDGSSRTSEMTVIDVVKRLEALMALSGVGSQELKEKELADVLHSLDVVSGKYVLRMIVGKLRLGFSDMTLLDAFSWMEKGDKSLREVLESAYNVCADIGHIIRVLKQEGVQALERSCIIPGIPVRPAGAERMVDAKAIVAKLGACVAQPKLDGFRLQVHKFEENGKIKVRFFSRNLLDMSDMFPDLSRFVREIPCTSFVAEGEAIACDPETGTFLPFQQTTKRRRKHGVEKTAEELPLQLYFFDLLYKDGSSLLGLSHEQRRSTLGALLATPTEKKINIIEEKKIATAKDLEDYFNECVSSGLEGLVVKKTTSLYQAGKRNFNWIKLKRQESGELTDTIDCVILGYYAGSGKRAGFGIGALLVGVYNKNGDRFETVAKIGSGLTDAEWREAKRKCDALHVSTMPKDVVCAKELVPDVWVSPEVVCQILADEITLSPLHKAGAQVDKPGYALRFPRIMGYRPDKSARDATTVEEIAELYQLQFEKEQRSTT